MFEEYKIIVTPKVCKDLKRIDLRISEKIIKVIKKNIQTNPYCGKKLSNVKVGQW